MNEIIIRETPFEALICTAQWQIKYENVIIDDH